MHIERDNDNSLTLRLEGPEELEAAAVAAEVGLANLRLPSLCLDALRSLVWRKRKSRRSLYQQIQTACRNKLDQEQDNPSDTQRIVFTGVTAELARHAIQDLAAHPEQCTWGCPAARGVDEKLFKTISGLADLLSEAA